MKHWKLSVGLAVIGLAMVVMALEIKKQKTLVERATANAAEQERFIDIVNDEVIVLWRDNINLRKTSPDDDGELIAELLAATDAANAAEAVFDDALLAVKDAGMTVHYRKNKNNVWSTLGNTLLSFEIISIDRPNRLYQQAHDQDGLSPDFVDELLPSTSSTTDFTRNRRTP